jgi:hypothetical protein
MMANPMYDASVPVFLRYLAQLSALVAKAEIHCVHADLDQVAILQARLSPDMHPFLSQVQIADDFALRACASLTMMSKPEYGAAETSLAGLRMRIGRTIRLLDSLSAARFAGAAQGVIGSQAGQDMVELEGMDFLRLYAMPNFFFHVAMAYAILRHVGVDVGKRDFDGFHRYPASLMNR